MSTPTPPPADRRLALLEQLATRGVSLARTLEHDAAAAYQAQVEASRDDPTSRLSPPFDFAGAGLQFASIARAARLTLTLHARLEAKGRPGSPPEGAAAPGE